MKIQTIGFVGLGIMGLPMARNLLRAGFALRVYNRTQSKAEQLSAAGATPCASPAEAAQGADAVITIVTDADAVEAVTFGDQGVVKSAAAGALVIDMTTISPSCAKQHADRLTERGLAPLDAPVSGSDVKAAEGTLSIMVGGSVEHFEQARPVFEALGSRIVRVGPSGSGQGAKACNQILCSVHLLATCEALSLARASGLDVEKMLDVVLGGAARSWILENLGPRILRGDMKPGFMVRLLQKDLNIVNDMAAKMQLSLPAASLATQLLRAAATHGHPEQGMQAMALAYEELTGVRLRSK